MVGWPTSVLLKVANVTQRAGEEMWVSVFISVEEENICFLRESNFCTHLYNGHIYNIYYNCLYIHDITYLESILSSSILTLPN